MYQEGESPELGSRLVICLLPKDLSLRSWVLNKLQIRCQILLILHNAVDLFKSSCLHKMLLFIKIDSCFTFSVKVSVSSLNRHAVATREDVGTPKALCLKKHFSAIFPECNIDAKVLLYDSSTEDEILSGNPDFVLDCIDNIDTKVRNISYLLFLYCNLTHTLKL